MSAAVGKRRTPAAVRVVDPETGPQLFVQESVRQALAKRIEAAHGCRVRLVIVDTLKWVYRSTWEEPGVLKAWVHFMFLGAPRSVLDALVTQLGDEPSEDAERIVGEWTLANHFQIRAKEPVKGKIRTKGEHHDLGRILVELNDVYFGGGLSDLEITWSKRTRPQNGKKRATIKLGSWVRDQRLIRINPVLDAKWVPRYFVSFIVYHELLHHVIPIVKGENGRALHHSPEFLEREREFRVYAKAVAWEQENIDRLLSS